MTGIDRLGARLLVGAAVLCLIGCRGTPPEPEAPATPAVTPAETATPTPPPIPVTPTPAAEAAPVSEPSWIIILGGGATPADATAAVQRFRAGAGELFELASGYPKTLSSADLEGLNPGFEIAVLGTCVDRAKADLARDLANLVMDGGVYHKQIPVTLPESCPGLPSSPAPEWTRGVEREPVSEKVERIAWVWDLEKQTHDNGCEFQTWRLAVVVGSVVLDETELVETCEPARWDPETDELDHPGAGTSWDVDRLRVGDRLFFTVDWEDWFGDNGTFSSSVYGFACGEIRSLEGRRHPMDPVPVFEEEETPPSDPNVWPAHWNACPVKPPEAP